MCSTRPSAKARRGAAGFTLIELMIGVVIGLLASLAVTHVLVNSEGQKRTTTSGSDAQVNGALALAQLQRSLAPAGYGFAATPAVIGCTVTATFNGAAASVQAPGFTTSLVPVTIVDGAAGAPDSIRVLSSGKGSYSIPLRVVAAGTTTSGVLNLPVASVRGIAAGDLVVASMTSSAAPSVGCEMFQISSNPGSAAEISRGAGAWNGGSLVNAYGAGAAIVNLGAPIDNTYSISNNSLFVKSLVLGTDTDYTPSYTNTELFPNIVQLQAMYGRDADSNGSVDTWNTTAPTDNAGWRLLNSVRIAVVARSTQYEKDTVTFMDPETGFDMNWDVGNAGTVAGSTTCGASKCVRIVLNTLGADWQHYRYKLYETIVPLRNLLWNS